ncbi:MAG: CPBP family intramembrane metalloprotease [Deltaproteobacteria bacterium]|nr:CPBP family intramembrane metalloprotease [Deltaproteobacteria bacterium]
MSGDEARAGEGILQASRSNAWSDLATVVPLFVGYHVGVVFLSVRNAADLVTSELTTLANHSRALYWLLTVAIGLALVAVLTLLGRGQSFELRRLLLVVVEAVLYAALMRVAAGYVVGALPLASLGPPAGGYGLWAGVVMSLGAGLYEELAFRVGLYGLGAWCLRRLAGSFVGRGAVRLGWALVAAAVFAGWHYLGPMGDAFEPRSFVFRCVCGLAFTLIYVARGFAPAVWTHALYDVWVLALR